MTDDYTDDPEAVTENPLACLAAALTVLIAPFVGPCLEWLARWG